jgi:hypothetical protein
MLVVALLLTAVSTGVSAREFRAADTRDDYPTVQALRYMGSLITERSGGRHPIKVLHSRQFGEEKGTLETNLDRPDRSQPYQRRIDRRPARPAMAQLIERIRKVE